MRPNSPRARAAASEILAGLAIRGPDELDVELIAAHLGACVIYKPLRREEGRLLRSGRVGLIVVNQHTQSSKKWRFVVSHEIGHFVMHRDRDLFLCTPEDMRAGARTDVEREANDFAAELLLPEALFRPLADVSGQPSLDRVRELADRFGVSLTSCALRFVRFCPEACAVVHSTSGRIDWAATSSAFPFEIARGQPLGKSSYAGDLHAGRAAPTRPEVIEATSWSKDERAWGLDIIEHSQRLGDFGSVLTLLWHGG
ncbi:MAG: ImmA/IrrE family metallo-endopeptidase [Myxococcales bacterium]|nr:ImmA/IrrE family metallo-endopeptidase [Myxococcales bacterium]